MGFLQRQNKHSTITKIVSLQPTCLCRKLQLYTQGFYFVFELGGEVWNFDWELQRWLGQKLNVWIIRRWMFHISEVLLHKISQMLKTRILEFVILLHHLQTSVSNQFYTWSRTQIIIKQVDSIDFWMSYLWTQCSVWVATIQQIKSLRNPNKEYKSISIHPKEYF